MTKRSRALSRVLLGAAVLTIVATLPTSSAFLFESIVDSQGTADGTPTSVNSGAGKVGNTSAVLTNSSYINFTTGNVWQIWGNNHATTTLWVNFTSVGGTEQYLITGSQGQCGAGSTCGMGFRLDPSVNQMVAFWHPANTGCAGRSATIGTTLKPNVWYHFAMVYNRAGGVGMEVYLNGTFVSSNFADTGNICGNATTRATLGYLGFTNGAHCRCALDDVRIYNRSLNATEVSNVFTNANVSTTEFKSSYQFETGFPGPITESPILTATGASGKVVLTWTSVNNAARYGVWYSNHSVFYPGTGSLNNTSYVYYGSFLCCGTNVTPLVDGQTYYFRVAGLNDFNDGPPSSEKSATPNSPQAPILSGRAWRTNAELSWTSGTLPNTTQYLLYKGPDVLNLTFYDATPNQTYVDPQLPGECDYYAVEAQNATATSGLSNAIQICYRPVPAPVGGDGGQIWGGGVDANGNPTGGRDALAAATGISSFAWGVLYSIICIGVGTVMGYYLTNQNGYGAAAGALGGALLSYALDLMPIWAYLFLAAIVIAGYLVYKRKQTGA